MTSWNDLIKKNINYSLSDSDLLNLCDNKVKIIVYTDLHQINSIDELLEPFGAVIILYQSKKDEGHWVTVLKQQNNIIEVFGSYGLDVDEQLEFSDYNKIQHGGQSVPHLSNILYNSNYKVIHNSIHLQSDNKNVNTCGRYSGLRVRFRDMSLSKFVNLFKQSKGLNNDEWVTALTLLFS